MIYLVTGRREQGKTTLAIALARRVVQRVLVDPRRQCLDVPVRAESPDEIVCDLTTLRDHPDIPELAVLPSGPVQPCADAVMLGTRAWIEADPSRQLAIVLDEARFIDLTSEPVEWVLRCAPRSSVHVLITAHRPTDVPVDVRAIVDQWCLFRTTQAHDLRAIAERCGARVAAAVEQLAPHAWIQWDDGRAEMIRHANPSAWYTPVRHVAGESQTLMIHGGESARDKARLFG
jgi:hypothetical protein